MTITDNVISLHFGNFGLSTQVLPQGIYLPTLCPLDGDQVSLLVADAGSSPFKEIPADSRQDDVVDEMIASGLPAAEAQGLYRLFESYKDIFDLGHRPVGQAYAVKHRINTSNAKPIRTRPYGVSHAERLAIKQQVHKMLCKDIIEPSYSPWSSPATAISPRGNFFLFPVLLCSILYTSFPRCPVGQKPLTDRSIRALTIPDIEIALCYIELVSDFVCHIRSHAQPRKW